MTTERKVTRDKSEARRGPDNNIQAKSTPNTEAGQVLSSPEQRAHTPGRLRAAQAAINKAFLEYYQSRAPDESTLRGLLDDVAKELDRTPQDPDGVAKGQSRLAAAAVGGFFAVFILALLYGLVCWLKGGH